MKDHLLVFVPGIMGTQLIYEGENLATNTSSTQMVWSSDINVLVKTLAVAPERLYSKTPLKVGQVLRKIELYGVASVEVYERLIDTFLCGEMGYREGEDLLLYGYDWRLSIATNAQGLAGRLAKMDPERPIKILAHSMGGLIARYMLANPSGAVPLPVKTLIQIATPVRGSSRAYYTLKKQPNFGALLASVLAYFFHRHLDKYHILMKALTTCQSIFELLPHETDRVLVTRTGRAYSALDAEAWPNVAEHDLDGVRQRQAAVRALNFPALSCIYCNAIGTHNYYKIDSGFSILEEEFGVSDGDGTVIVDSASLGTPLERRHVIEDRVDHIALPNNKAVWKKLQQELF